MSQSTTSRVNRKRIRYTFSYAARAALFGLVVGILAMLSGDRISGQIIPAFTAVDFDGSNDYITFGAATGASGLNVTNFTLELWFKREGAGVTTTTSSDGGGGLSPNIGGAVPLVAKGRGEADNSNVDMNYFLGLNPSGGNYFLAADFEEGSAQTSPGLNHAIVSSTPIALNTWYHAAATFNSSTGVFNLYLNGVLDTTMTIGATRAPRSDSIQHGSIGSALTSDGTAAGFFNGVADEVRIWNVVRTEDEIWSNRNVAVTSGTGLIGRWNLDQGTGTSATNSVAGRPNGTLTNGPLWVVAPADSTLPTQPQNIAAAVGNGLVTVSWTANPDIDLLGYNVYRSTSLPVQTTGTPLNGVTPLERPIFTDNTPLNGTLYHYAVRAIDTHQNFSIASSPVSVTPGILAGAGMQFNGSSQYVTFGTAAGLGAQTFTLEAWIKRVGAGIATSTGAATGGGITAIPLITKGMAQSDGSNVDMNYFLGISPTTGFLSADFEDSATGLNHSVVGDIAIPIDATSWRHVAATYDGTTWRLYLDGVLNKELLVGNFTPRSDSIQHAAIATALQSTPTGVPSGQTQGFFNGLVDEVRIWNYARTQFQIQATKNQEIVNAAGLLGRWGLNEATGTTIASSAQVMNGTATGTPRWTAGYPFPPDTDAPAAPQNLVATAGHGQVSLTWTPNSEPDLRGYNVYRRTFGSSFGLALNASPLFSPQYTDSAVVNETEYFYVVTAVDSFNASGFSNEASATPSANLPPVVSAGPDRAIPLQTSALLSGSATDDGPPANLSVLWTETSGPGDVTFASATSANTTATFTETGSYVLRLTASDTVKTAFDEMTVTVSDPVLVGAGDIAPNCTVGDSIANAEATATLLDSIPGTVFTLGDNAYLDGTAAQFANCYGPTWGRHKARTRPVTGNHDYNTPNGTGYYDYFNGVGVQDGPAGNRTTGGYYSYNLGNWHIVVLNSECTTLWNTNGCTENSPQVQWLRNDLATSPTNNIIAMWHRPLYSSGGAASTHPYLQPLWQTLYDYGVDIWLGGHWHNYERLAPMNAIGASDATFGIRTFVVGTGGINRANFSTILPTSQVRNNTDYGVIKFTLHESSYDWQFIPIAGDTFTDSGTNAVVHGPPSGNGPPVVDAGSDQSVGSAATLSGVVTDDGLPGVPTITWSKVSGPGTVNFGNPNATSTSAGFTVAGVYVLRLTVDDGQFIRTDVVTITASSGSPNLPPTVNAGPDQFIFLPSLATLAGVVTHDGLPGPNVTTTWSKFGGPGTVTFTDASSTGTTAGFSVAGTYVLRLTANDSVLSTFDDLTVTVSPVEVNRAIDFGGTNAYVTFGAAPGLGVSTMTIEAWFRRDGTGVATSTGSSGMTAIPIVTKGMAEDDTPANINMNYFLGIRSSDNVLGADFEDSATGLNHPAFGVTPITNGVWHHAAATYDGSTWRLYLDGTLESTTSVGSFTPQSASIQHAVIGSALNSTGGIGSQTQGFFNGAIDEVRVWNRALSLVEIQTNINLPIPSAGNLVARWGLNEGAGTAVNDSTINPINGAITGTNYAWTTGAPFNILVNLAPNAPSLNAPSNNATGQPLTPTLSVNVSDPNGDPLTVTFYGRSVSAGPVPEFTIVALPDTQHYSDDATRAATFTMQTQWIVANKTALNIPFVTHLGDIVENIDAVPVEWTRADTSMDVLDGQVPYGLAPGNHDMNSSGIATNYDQFFGVARMENYPWYGGYLGKNLFGQDPVDRLNKDNFELFSAGGMDFIIIHLEYDMPGYAVNWANKILAQYPNRRAIISTHLFLNDSGDRPTTVLNRTADGTPASTVWSNLIFPNCNVFLVLNGHYPGEANRTDPNSCGQPVHQLESDYQSRINGGDGWLRYMTFKPAENKIYVYTYSPKLGQFETDADSQFVVDYNMQTFSVIATNTGVASGGSTTTPWPNRASNTQYEWYAAVSDGAQTTDGPTWKFTTAAPANVPPVAVDDTVTTAEDTARVLTQAEMKGNDTDADNTNAQLSVTAVSNAASGSVLLNGNGTVTFTPTANFTGAAGFDYTLSDGSGTDTGHVTVTVTPVNDRPVAVDDTPSTNEDTAVTLSNLTANDVDIDGPALSVTAVANGVNGTAVRNANGSVTFTPAANFNGIAGFDYTVSDGTLTDTGHATVTVNPINDPPVAVDDTASTTEDAPLTLTQATLKGDDTDIDNTNAQLSVTAVSNAVNGSVLLNPDGTVTFTPALNFTGAAGFDYTVSDGSGTDTGHVTVTVDPGNDPPVAVDDTASTTEETAVTLSQSTLRGNDTDVDNSTGQLSVTAVSNAVNGTAVRNANGSVTFTPTPNFSGVAGFDYTVSDGDLTDVGHVTVTVNGVNDPPAAVDDTASATEDTPLILAQTDLKGNDTDVDNTNAQLSVTAVSTATNGSVLLNGDGTVTFTPSVNFSGTAGFDYTLSDGSLTDAGHMTVTVNAVNDPPTISNIADLSTNEDTATNAIPFTIADAETAAGALTLSRSSSNPTLVPDASIVFGGSGGNRTVTVTPAPNQSGMATITVTVSDGAVTSNDTFVLTVTAVNDPPTISNIVDQTTTPNTPIDAAFTVGDLESLATLSLSGASSNPTLIPNGSITFSGTGSSRTVTLTPATGQTGSATITVTVSDGVSSANDTFVLNVNGPGVGPSVQVLSPNGGNKLFTGSAYVITWNAVAGTSAIASFNVQYSTNSGVSFVPVPGCANLGATIRQCSWATPVATNAGRIRVIATDTASRNGSDDSDTDFSVVAGTPLVTVTGPTTDMSVGVVVPITWNHNIGTASFVATFMVEISRNGTSGPWEVLATNVPQLSPTTGSFNWTVVGPTSSRVRFRVGPTNFAVKGTSGSNLSIISPTLVLSSPVSGTTWNIGKNATFRWSASLGSSETVKIELSRDGGSTWEPIVTAVTADSGRYTWTVTGPATTRMRARVTSNANPSLTSASSGDNTIR